MQIQWFGLGCFLISGKVGGEETACIIDSYTADFGLRPPRSLSGIISMRSHVKGYAENVDIVQAPEGKDVFSVTHAGEFEVGGIFVNGISVPTKEHPEHTIYRVWMDDMSIGFLGALDRPLKDSEIEALGEVHILVIPVGGDDVLSPSMASDLVAQVEPRIVIPSHYHTEGLTTKHGGVESFIKNIGIAPINADKFKITKSGLPEEDMQLIVLTP